MRCHEIVQISIHELCLNKIVRQCVVGFKEIAKMSLELLGLLLELLLLLLLVLLLLLLYEFLR